VSSSKWSVKLKIIGNTEYGFWLIEQKETDICIIVKERAKKKEKEHAYPQYIRKIVNSKQTKEKCWYFK
jgi:hypothetical protein